MSWWNAFGSWRERKVEVRGEAKVKERNELLLFLDLGPDLDLDLPLKPRHPPPLRFHGTPPVQKHRVAGSRDEL